MSGIRSGQEVAFSLQLSPLLHECCDIAQKAFDRTTDNPPSYCSIEGPADGTEWRDILPTQRELGEHAMWADGHEAVDGWKREPPYSLPVKRESLMAARGIANVMHLRGLAREPRLSPAKWPDAMYRVCGVECINQFDCQTERSFHVAHGLYGDHTRADMNDALVEGFIWRGGLRYVS